MVSDKLMALLSAVEVEHPGDRRIGKMARGQGWRSSLADASAVPDDALSRATSVADWKHCAATGG